MGQGKGQGQGQSGIKRDKRMWTEIGEMGRDRDRDTAARTGGQG